MDEERNVPLDVHVPDPAAAYADALLARANGENIPSGILHWSFVMPYRITEFDGEEWRGSCDQRVWMQLYHEIHGGQKRNLGIVSASALVESLGPWHERDEVPIAFGCYRYDTPKRTFVAEVISATRAGRAVAEPESAERVLQQKTAFFASALLPRHWNDFESLPYEHYGLDVSFVVPRALFLTNLDGEPHGLEVDFDDGEGFRPVAFDETIRIAYGDDLSRTIRARIVIDGRTLGASFDFRVADIPTPVPNEHWKDLTAVEAYKGVTATGQAWVYYRDGGTNLTDPMIFADGFGGGATDLKIIWRQLNAGGLAFGLRKAGKDLIILGYKEKSTYVQANAMLAVRCIEMAIAKRAGAKPLVVAGGSMGGLVTRYALLWMEHFGRKHQTATYLSYDTPHSGAWLPVIIQHFAHYFRGRTQEAEEKSNLIRSFAAQQLLWAWLESTGHDPVTDNALREGLIGEMGAMGTWPAEPRRYAVANGTSDGTGNGAVPGVKAFDWEHKCVGSRPLIQPTPATGKHDHIGEMWTGGNYHVCYTKGIPPFDGAPGGMAAFFGQAAQGAEQSSWGTVRRFYDRTCFVPTVSALAAGPNRMLTPFMKIADIPRQSIPFHEWTTATSNTNNANMNHVDVSPEMTRWVVDKCAPKTE